MTGRPAVYGVREANDADEEGRRRVQVATWKAAYRRLADYRITTCVAIAALKASSNRSFISYKLPHFAGFCLALTASPTFFNSLQIPDSILECISSDHPPRGNHPAAIAASRRSFVAENEAGEIVGFSVGGVPRQQLDNYKAEVWALYVLPAYQGQGIGRQLFQALVAELGGEGCPTFLWVLKENSAACRFYERLGGKRLSHEKMFYWGNKPIALEVAYGWGNV